MKTTLILLALLIAVIALIGTLFFFSTRSMMQNAHRSQVNSFAYGVSATLGDVHTTPGTIQLEFNALDKTPNLDFVVLTDLNGTQVAGITAANATAPNGRCLQYTDSPSNANVYDPHSYAGLNHASGTTTGTRASRDTSSSSGHTSDPAARLDA